MIITRMGVVAASKSLTYTVDLYAKFGAAPDKEDTKSYSLIYNINGGSDQVINNFQALGIDASICNYITTITVNSGNTFQYGCINNEIPYPIKYNVDTGDCPSNSGEYCGTVDLPGSGTYYDYGPVTSNSVLYMTINVINDTFQDCT